VTHKGPHSGSRARSRPGCAVNRPLLAALFMSLLLLIYLAFALNYAWILINDASLLAQVMGYALGLLPLLGVWALIAELRFGHGSARLARKLEADGGMPTEFSLTASGRADRTSAEEVFPQFAQAVETSRNPGRCGCV